MDPLWTFVLIALILVLMPALLRLMDEPVDWSRYSPIHHAARLTRRAIAYARSTWRARFPAPEHQHDWHRIAACRGCGAVHRIRETSTP